MLLMHTFGFVLPIHSDERQEHPKKHRSGERFFIFVNSGRHIDSWLELLPYAVCKIRVPVSWCTATCQHKQNRHVRRRYL